MRHRDDDLSPFRDDPVVKALSEPGTPAELADEAKVMTAYREAVGTAVPLQRRRSAARVATGGTVAVLVLAVSGGAAAAYTNHLPEKWQQKLHDQIPSIPEPKPATSAPSASQRPTPVVVPPQTATPSTVPTGAGKPTPKQSPGALPTATVSPQPTSSLPVVVPTHAPTSSSSPTPTPTPSPSSSEKPVPVSGAELQIHAPKRVTVGAALTVTGKLSDAHGDPIADRRIVLVERVVGVPGRHRVGSGTTSASGEVRIEAPAAQRNVRLVLRSGRAHSAPQRVVVVPILHVQVPATAAGQTSVTVAVSVTGGQTGDVVILRGASAQQATLSSSSATSFTVPVSQSRTLHYRVTVQRSHAHAAHSLAFYVPASGG
jgi:hypothetical protein